MGAHTMTSWSSSMIFSCSGKSSGSNNLAEFMPLLMWALLVWTRGKLSPLTSFTTTLNLSPECTHKNDSGSTPVASTYYTRTSHAHPLDDIFKDLTALSTAAVLF